MSIRSSSREWRQEHPEYVRAHSRAAGFKRFNITEEQYLQMLADQDGCCAICGTDDSGIEGRRFSIDHDHNCCPSSVKCCGECTRGLLCNLCNQGLGRFRDDPELLRKAIDYLQKTVEV